MITATRPETTSTARSITSAALAVEVLVLLVSGIVLFFIYRPASGQPWADTDVPPATLVTATRTLHGLASWSAMLTSLVLLAIIVWSRRWFRAGLAAVLSVVVVIGAFSGQLLAWDQLALRSVTLGRDLDGFRPFFTETVLFVLVGNTEVARDTFVRWLAFHVVVPVVLMAALTLALRREPRPDA